MATRAAIQAIAILALAACITEEVDEDGIDDLAGGKADGFGLSPAEARGVLRVANEVSRDDLVGKAKLSARAADGIEAHRLGADGVAASPDDDKLDTLEELDAVPYIGSIAFEKLLAYARELGWVADYKLPGFDETLLVADTDGKLAVLRIGDSFSRREVAGGPSTWAELIRSRAGKFYVVYPAGKIAVVDPALAKVTQTITLPGPTGDIEWLDDGSLYATQTKGAIAHVDADGQELHTIDLSALRVDGGRVVPRRMARVRGRVFVQVARTQTNGRAGGGAIAVIDTSSHTIEKVIELATPAGDGGSSTFVGLEPDFAMAYDGKRDLLFVSAAGVRPSNTGAFYRIDATTLAIHDWQRAQSGFQGIGVTAMPFDTAFIIYHTSTPTTSSHLFGFTVAPDGTLVPDDSGTIVDAFDGLDALAINRAGTLVTMANTCITGFCIGGAGLNMVDAHTRELLPKLLNDMIGFEPSLVAFL